jgi:hypothetical protein
MKINNFETENVNGISQFVAIDDENGTTTIMLKSTYDEMIAAQSTPSVE